MKKLNKRKATRKKECSNLGQSTTKEYSGSSQKHVMPRLLTAKDIAALLQCSERTIRRWAYSGNIMPPPTHIERLVRWRYEDIMTWITTGCPKMNKFKAQEVV